MFRPTGRPTCRPLPAAATAAPVQRLGDRVIVVCCAFCARVRDSAGRWVRVPAGVGESLYRGPVALSHGYCPDCTARHFG